MKVVALTAFAALAILVGTPAAALRTFDKGDDPYCFEYGGIGASSGYIWNGVFATAEIENMVRKAHPMLNYVSLKDAFQAAEDGRALAKETPGLTLDEAADRLTFICRYGS